MYEDEMDELDDLLDIAVQKAIRILSNPEFPKALAKLCGRFYNCLLAEGFTKEEAIQIVTHFKWGEK